MTMERVSGAPGPAIRYTARLKLNSPTKTFFTHTVGYMVLHGDSVYVVTYTSAPERATAMDTLAEQSIQTLKFF
jgi:hypothetical protein